MAPLDELAGGLVAGDLVADPDRMAEFSRDQANDAVVGGPLCLVVARCAEDVVSTLTWATRHRVPVVPRGAGTGLAGGANAVDGCVLLSLDQMNAITELSVEDRLAKVEPGVVTADLARAAAEHGLLYGPDPGSAERSTLGGNLATNAGGFRCIKYGVTRDSVLALDVVLADGRRIATGSRATKGVTGYDLSSLFVGSEGTLGVIVGATLRLQAKPSTPPVTVAAYFSDATAAARASVAVVRAGLRPSMMELVDEVTLRALQQWRPVPRPQPDVALLLGQADTADAAARLAGVCRDTGALAVVVTADETEAQALLDVRRLALGGLERLGRTLVEDFVVPQSRLPQMTTEIRRIADEYGVFVGTVAHAGDGNLHPTFLYDRDADAVPERVWAAADQMFGIALGLGGTLSGEHGVGVLKRHWLRAEIGDTGIGVHDAIKKALDPLGIMNPGKVL
ncbi:FAD-linked oxidase C-terminal domain-containing protein [Micromonospora sp. NPDC049559]|uniref:FAD-binding oxidoreductase n=1 Tax=Micromonospora sp. NPDC049559 TaxID=3155923 RepID=UPI003430A140